MHFKSLFSVVNIVKGIHKKDPLENMILVTACMSTSTYFHAFPPSKTLFGRPEATLRQASFQGLKSVSFHNVWSSSKGQICNYATQHGTIFRQLILGFHNSIVFFHGIDDDWWHLAPDRNSMKFLDTLSSCHPTARCCASEFVTGRPPRPSPRRGDLLPRPRNKRWRARCKWSWSCPKERGHAQ